MELVLGEMISMPRYEMLPYLLCPGPLNTTNEALGSDIMLVSYMPFNVLTSSVASIATIVIARPPLGAHYAILGTLRNCHF